MAAASVPVPAAAVPRTDGPTRLLVQRKCTACGATQAAPDCAACKRKRLQRHAAGGSGFAGLSAPGRIHQALAQPGRPLDPGTRGLMERRFATSFADVRIHDDALSHRASRALAADAFACGQHVHFASGQYRPSTTDGIGLIAHELAHTIQQRPLSPPTSTELEVGAPGSHLEQAADAAAARVVAGLEVAGLNGAPSALIQRNASAAVEQLDDLLSYGLFDWAITDAEAIEALTRLKGLPRIEQAEFISDPKFAGRLRDNLPQDHLPELDAIAADVKSMLPSEDAVEAVIDKLSYGLFDWAITDQEAVEALELLETLSGEPLAIALKRIDVGRLMDNLPEGRRQELSKLLSAALGPAGTLPTSERQQPGTALRSLDFISDQAVMRDNAKDWSNEGKPFPQPDWAVSEKGEVRSDAISHTMGEQVQIDLALDVTPANATGNAVLTGKGSSPFLDFSFTGGLGGGPVKQRLSSTAKLPDGVAAYRGQAIDWSIKWGTWTHPIGTTGPFDIFTTVGPPKRPDQVTTNRMAKAVELVSSAPTLKPHDVVKYISSKWTTFNLDVIYANEWEVAADIEKGAQCIDLVRFVQSVIGTVGLPGNAEAVVIWAQPTAPLVAIETPYGAPGGMVSIPPPPSHPDWHPFLIDGDFRPNNYEAALKFTADGTTRYYPGGVKTVFDKPDDVLTVFECLAWIRVTGADH